MIFSITSATISEYNKTNAPIFPKYTTQIINLANRNAQGTRPNIVGILNKLFPEFLRQSDNVSVAEWEEWYMSQHPNAIEDATNRIQIQLDNLVQAIQVIDRDMVERWVRDLVINKTFNGMYFQEAILAEIAHKKGEKYRLGTSHEEAMGIDGYVGNTAYSIKPITYKLMDTLHERIDAVMVYYTKTNTGINVEVIEK